MEKARLVCFGGHQFVILPEEFRFMGAEVTISRDGKTGDVVLSATTHSWSDFDETADVPADFLSDRSQGVENRDPFDGWVENSDSKPPGPTTK